MITLRAIAVGLGLSALVLFFSVGAFAADTNYTAQIDDEFLDTIFQISPTIAEVAKDFFRAETCGQKTIKDFTIGDFYDFMRNDRRATVFIMLKYSLLPLNFPAREDGRNFLRD